MYRLKNCPICGASELKKISIEEHNSQEVEVYKCLSCDTELSSYEKYLKTVKNAPTTSSKNGRKFDKEDNTDQEGQSPNRTAIVNIAAEVYNKAICSTLALVAKMDNGVMSGTGTMVSENGYFITNAHVVTELAKNHKTILNFSEEVYGQSGENNYRFVAELVYAKPTVDLALLKTEPSKELVSVNFSKQIAFPGEAVYAIGNSKGEGLCIVEGIVSDVHRKIGDIDAIMISAPVTHGNSGGPVFDAEGNLLGIVQSGRNDVSSMNYVIPVDIILSFLQEAKEKEGLEF